MLAVGNDRQFRSCTRSLGIEDLADDSRFSSNEARVLHRQELLPLLCNAFVANSTDHWLSAFAAADVPAGPINNIKDVLSDQFADEKQLVRQMHHPYGKDMPTVANPVQFSSTVVDYRSAPPILGQHTSEVLSEWLGYSDVDIQKLATSKTI